jgi:hypothetical protein
MNTHEFTLTIPDAGILDFDKIEALMDAAGNDSTVAFVGGLVRLSFARQASTRAEAIEAAVRDVARAGFRVGTVEGEVVRRSAGDIPPATPEHLAGLLAAMDGPIDTSDIPESTEARRAMRPELRRAAEASREHDRDGLRHLKGDDAGEVARP